MSELFPCRARIGSTDYGLDADHADHKNTSVAYPELVVVNKDEPQVIWHPDGVRFRVIGGPAPFGFHPKDDG